MSSNNNDLRCHIGINKYVYFGINLGYDLYMKQTNKMIKAGTVRYDEEMTEAHIWLQDAWCASLRMVRGDATEIQFRNAVGAVLKAIPYCSPADDGIRALRENGGR